MLSYFWKEKYKTAVLLMLVIAYSFDQFERYIFTTARIPFIDYHGEEYAFLVGPVFVLIYTFFGVLLGFLSDRVHRVFGLSVALALWSLMTALIAFTDQYWLVAMCRIGQAIAQAACNPFACGIIADYFDLSVRGTALSIYNGGIYLGYTLALSVGTIMMDNYGWKTSFFIPGCSGIVFSLVLFAFVREPIRGSDDNIPTEIEVNRVPNEKNSFHLTNFSCLHWFGPNTKLVLLVSFASGIRNISGFVWASYSTIFFSPLYEKSPVQTVCTTSFGTTNTTALHCEINFPFCIAKICHRLSNTPWHNIGLSHADFEAYYSWIPLIAGSCGAVFGGFVSDYLVAIQQAKPTINDSRNRMNLTLLYPRLYVLMFSCFAAAPFSYLALRLSSPWCFTALFIGLFCGEMFTGVCLASVIQIVPASVCSSVVGFYFFVCVNIAGNSVIFVPYLSAMIKKVVPSHIFVIHADDYLFHESHNGADPLYYSLLCLVVGPYIIAFFLFSISLYLNRNSRSIQSPKLNICRDTVHASQTDRLLNSDSNDKALLYESIG